MKLIRRRNFTMSVLAVSIATALVGADRVHAAPIPVPGDGGSVSTTLAINQEIPVLGGTTSTDIQTGSVEPGQAYTVLCYRDGDTVTNTQTKSSSQRWALIADPANPATSLGYVPAIAFKFNDITNQVPACIDTSVDAPPKPEPKPPKEKSLLNALLAFPLFFAFTKNAVNQQTRADCLNHRPSGLTSKVESNGVGWNEYTTGPGGRAATATACLDSTHIAGTGAADGLVVVGLAAAQAKAISQNTAADPPAPWATPRTRDVARCHLIAGANKGSVGSLGGNGSEPSNFVPCWGQPTNNPGMTTPEEAVRRYAGDTGPGEAILYVVKPHYDTFASTVPTSITMVAYLQSPGMPPPGKEVVFEIAPNEKAFTTVGNHQIVINLGD
ncbi:hypothetical protein [Actinoallomurus sp. CA-150999]|uniref:hypothetical protein n=1 Tax=Actinoallomurus sp. CA-150999 TaxID=3239887 RepID=UPI003D8E4B91